MKIPVETLSALCDSRHEFSDVIPGLQMQWAASSIETFKTCPRLYFYSKILRYSPKGLNEPMMFGVIFHQAMETYEIAREKLDLSHKDAMFAAVKCALTESIIRVPDPDGETDFDTWHSMFSGEDNRRTRQTLVRAVVWALEQFNNTAFQTVKLADGTPAVELRFDLSLQKSNSAGEIFSAYGFMDKIVSMDDQTFYILDRKTTATTINNRFFKRYSPDTQVSLYTIAGQVCYGLRLTGMMIEGTQLAVGFSRSVRGFVNRPQGVLDEWLEDLGHYLDAAERYAKAGYWPTNDASCSKYGGCDFQDICSKPPNVRQNFLEANFTKRKVVALDEAIVQSKPK